jgi:hypothetical protein
MSWAINFAMFGMSDVTFLDSMLPSDDFDDPEWKWITAVVPQCPIGKSCINKNKFFKRMMRRYQILDEKVSVPFHTRGGYS